MHRFYSVVIVVALVAALPEGVEAQLAEFEQAMSKLEEKLPADVWDGNTLNVSTYEELLEVRAFLSEYDRLTKVAKDAFSRLGDAERTDERKNTLNDHIAWMNVVIEAFNDKYEVLKPRKVSPFLGPDVGQGKPFVVDTLGMQSTELQIKNHRGPTKGGKEQPYRYSILAEFLVHYDDISQEDVVLLQPTKGGKKLGSPKVCSPERIYEDAPLALFDCETHESYPEYTSVYSAAGDIEVALTYRKVVEGKEFKNFGSLLLHVVKQAQMNGPPKWGMDADMELGPSTIQEKFSRQRDGWGDGIEGSVAISSSPHTETVMAIQTMFKTNGSAGPEKIACFYQGKRVDESEASSLRIGAEYELKSWKSGDWDTSIWRKSNFRFTFLGARPDPDEKRERAHYLSENPGKYKCVITGGGTVLKELRFEVGTDGEIIKPPCQAESVNAPRSVTLLSTTLKKPYNKKWDKQIAAKRGYGGGVSWTKGCPPTD